MRQNKRTDWQWVAIFIWMAASIGGIFYSFRFLIGATGIFIIYLCSIPRDNVKSRGWKALSQIYEWQKNGGPRPSEDVFRTAADWYMYSIDTVRAEDLNTHKGVAIPDGVKKYIKSERDFPRQTGIIF